MSVRQLRHDVLGYLYRKYMGNHDEWIPWGRFDATYQRELAWLEGQGWIEYRRTEDDGPVLFVRLTVEGREEYERRLVEGGNPCPTCGAA